MKHSPFKKVLVLALCLFGVFTAAAQEVSGISADIRAMSKETDPAAALRLKSAIIEKYRLDSVKDAETFDLLNGTVAMAYAARKQAAGFEKYISLVRNRFNRTSFMNMTANQLLDKQIDNDYAAKLAKETLDLYFSFKDDPAARPAGYTEADWKRFMDYARYPYYDTYAKALFAQQNYAEALKYQRLAFDGKPEEGFPPSVERYARLLELTGDREASRQLLLTVTRLGKLNKGMIAQLESIYVAEKGNNTGFDAYLDSLQNTIQPALMAELSKKMLNEKAPGFSLKDLSGKQVSLADYKGRIVILDLWATWCAPCIASFPAMQKQVEKHPDVAFLFIAVDEKGSNALERVKGFIAKNNYPFKVLMDEPLAKSPGKYVITSAYQPDGIPAKYFIDRNGMLRFKSKGFDTDQELMNEVDAMIAIMKKL